MSNVTLLAKRITDIRPFANPNGYRSHMRLYHEYVRRLGLYATSFGWGYFNVLTKDIPGMIDPLIRANAEVTETVVKYALGREFDAVAIHIFLMALHWEALRDSEVYDTYKLLPLYEPLIMIYERGGWLSTEQNWVDVTGIGIPPKRWEQCLASEPLFSLDTDFLDGLDNVR